MQQNGKEETFVLRHWIQNILKLEKWGLWRFCWNN